MSRAYHTALAAVRIMQPDVEARLQAHELRELLLWRASVRWQDAMKEKTGDNSMMVN